MRFLTDETSTGYHLVRYAALVISGILMGIPIGSMLCQPAAKAVFTTAQIGAEMASGADRVIPGPAPVVMMGGVDPNGIVAQINLDAQGRVIAKCDLEP